MRLKTGIYDEIDLFGVALSASNNEAAKSLGKAHWLAFELAQKKYPNVYIVEPSGLDPKNKSSALALALGALEISNTSIAAYTLKKIVTVNKLNFNNTNPLLQKSGWNFKLSKTGFINESGGCLVVVFTVSGRDYSVAILGSANTKQRWADLSQLRYLISDEPYFVYNSIQKKAKHK
jgi:D-alanyl-D-alanine endopeptidase (penicillin-binding protein 7)